MKYISFFGILVLFVLLITLSCAKKEVTQFSLPEGKSAKIVFILGEVFITSPTEEWVLAKVGDVLEEGTKVKTGENSYCEIVLSSGTLFRLKDRSELLLSLLPEDRRNNKSLTKLAGGDLLTKVNKIAYRSEDGIETESVTLGIRGTEFLVHTDGEETLRFTDVLVSEGVVNARLNVPIPSKDEIPRELRSIFRDLERGVDIEGGYKIQVTNERVEGIIDRLKSLEKVKPIGKAEIEALKQEVTIKPLPLDEKDRERIKELKELSLNYRMGQTFYLSPNFDGINDEFSFNTGDFKGRKIQGWKLVIFDGKSSVEKVIKSSIPEDVNYVEVPEIIPWNMVNEGGNIVNDGNYAYGFYISEKEPRELLKEKGIIVVDTVTPSLSIIPESTTFSPNGDGIKDTIKFNITAEPEIHWNCSITTKEGIVVKTIEWGKDIPSIFEWDGRGENGNILPEGVYDITVIGQDNAGNKTALVIRGIALDLRERRATLDINNPIISPNGDGILDTVTFTPILSDKSRIDTWDLIVQTEKGDTARRFRGIGNVPERILWDGNPQRGKGYENLPPKLPSGKYIYFIKVVYKSGVNTFSFKKEIVIDNDPPEINVSVNPEIFSPDGDKNNDLLYIKPEIRDLTLIQNWKATIHTAAGGIFKTFSGDTMPRDEIAWDGISDAGRLVDSGEDYYLIFEAADSGFNRGISKRSQFSIDILVIPTERGLKIQVSNIEFGFNTATPTGEKTFIILNKILEVLKKYDRYSVTIEGHTDSSGDKNYNLTLSKQRAEAVGAYLVKNGISADRLSYKGYGSEFPVDTNETREGRARNRRVEFILVKKG